MSLVVGTNSWATLAEAEAYFGDRIDTEEWEILEDEEKEKYLVTSFRWIYQNPAFDVPKTSSDEAVKDGQCEAALYLVKFSKDHERRAAMITSGVKNFQLSKWSESLGSVSLPANVENIFSKNGYYKGGVSSITLVDDSVLT